MIWFIGRFRLNCVSVALRLIGIRASITGVCGLFGFIAQCNTVTAIVIGLIWGKGDCRFVGRTAETRLNRTDNVLVGVVGMVRV